MIVPFPMRPAAARDPARRGADNDLTPARRAALAETCVALACGVGHYYADRLGVQPADRDEMVSAALFGLVRASQLYRDDRGTEFASYAGLHAHARVRDWIRRHRSRGFRYVPAGFAGRHVRLASGAGEPVNVIDLLPAPEPAPCWDAAAWDDLLRPLGERPRRVLEMLYRDGLSERAIGLKLGVSRTRVWQIAQRSIAKLRRHYGTEDADFGRRRLQACRSHPPS